MVKFQTKRICLILVDIGPIHTMLSVSVSGQGLLNLGSLVVGNASMVVCLFVRGFTPYQQYFSYLTATVHKSMFPGLF